MIFDLLPSFKSKKTPTLETGCLSLKGRVRNINQDNLYQNGYYLPEDHQDICTTKEISLANDSFYSFCVFDGMGGELYGEKAAYIAARTFHDELNKLEDLTDPFQRIQKVTAICQTANNRIVAYAQEHEIPSMGTTVAGIIFWKDQYVGFNLGDSRIYKYANGLLTQLSQDHVRRRNFYTSSGLTQFLGIPEEEFLLSPEVFCGELKENDSFLLCTDGVTRELDDNSLKKFMASTAPMDRKRKMSADHKENTMRKFLDRMTNEINKGESMDNASLQIINYKSL